MTKEDINRLQDQYQPRPMAPAQATKNQRFNDRRANRILAAASAEEPTTVQPSKALQRGTK